MVTTPEGGGREGKRRGRGRSTDVAALEVRLRDQILARLHAGLLRPGDALPPLRETAADTGADPRTIMRCYRRFAATGLVEIRPRRGVYIPAQFGSGSGATDERIQWLTSVMMEARQRGISLPSFTDYMYAATRGQLHCVVVDDVRDAAEAIERELMEDIGARVTIISTQDPSDVVCDADVIVTSAFCVEHGLTLSVRWNKPIVVITLAALTADIIRSTLTSVGLTLIVADQRFGDRVRRVYAPILAKHDTLEVILASDAKAISLLDRSRPVLATVSALRLLPHPPFTPLIPRYPSMSSESARELIERTLRLNLEREL